MADQAFTGHHIISCLLSVEHRLISRSMAISIYSVSLLFSESRRKSLRHFRTAADHQLATATSSYLPVHFTDLQAILYDLETNKVVATGNYRNHVVSRKENVPVVVPVEFSYSALNASDSTCTFTDIDRNHKAQIQGLTSITRVVICGLAQYGQVKSFVLC